MLDSQDESLNSFVQQSHQGAQLIFERCFEYLDGQRAIEQQLGVHSNQLSGDLGNPSDTCTWLSTPSRSFSMSPKPELRMYSVEFNLFNFRNQ